MRAFLIAAFVFNCQWLAAQAPAGYQRAYRLLRSGNVLVDKNFYLLTVIQQTPAVQKLLRQDTALVAIGQERLALLKAHAQDTSYTPAALVGGFCWSGADSARLLQAVRRLYGQPSGAFGRLVATHLRPSGCYQRFAGRSDEEMLLGAWGQYVTGINYIIDQYGLGKKLRYPRIDSASYPVNSRYYRIVLKDMMGVLAEEADSLTLFYQPSLAVALRLMDANDRDEPARHEPMEQRDNRLAFARVGRTDWKKYRYAAIVVPGNGPELATTPLSPVNKMRLDMVAARYHRGWAPFIIVSGGYCYPFRGPYGEAVEMKRYLMQRWAVPESALLIDPHARHTTTNLRNANRLLYRYGFPTDKPCAFTTTRSQADYVDNVAFDARNQRELGYLPYRDKQRLSPHDLTFYPTVESLHMDPLDPLDP